VKPASLGDQELKILQYVSEHAPVSVRDVAAHFAAEEDLARTTVLTVMERLRKKGFLDRKQSDGAFAYSPRREQSVLLHELVENFLNRTLGGSFDPFIAYLTTDAKLTDQQVDELRKLVERLERKDGSHGS
jgi:predicted transcriptional regulator